MLQRTQAGKTKGSLEWPRPRETSRAARMSVGTRSHPFRARCALRKARRGAGRRSSANRWPRSEATSRRRRLLRATAQGGDARLRSAAGRRQPGPRGAQSLSFFPSNPGGSDVRRMWAAPRGPALEGRSLKGAGHVGRGPGSLESASPWAWTCRRSGAEVVGAGERLGKTVVGSDLRPGSSFPPS